jgi:hypothetical protein
MQPMETIPNEGFFKLYFIDHKPIDATWEDGFEKSIDGTGGTCSAFVALFEGEHPECWTDGVCWEVNESGKPSMQPIGWGKASKAKRSK